ncbi:MAG: thioredoxin-dependent thiol peroxidase [Dehalococcoidia bacterium]
MNQNDRELATTAPPRDQPLRPGDHAPEFTLPAIASDGTQFDVSTSSLRGRKTLLVFYQDDGMPICTSELNAFAQEYDLLAAKGVDVYGINTNGLGSHQRFQERDRFPFPLLSDFFGDVVKAFGFWDPDERKSRRGVVILDEDNTVAFVQPHFNPNNISAFEEIFRALGVV